METLQRDFELIGEPKLQQKKQKSIPCRSDFLGYNSNHILLAFYMYSENYSLMKHDMCHGLIQFI